jgi:hypothetical protein
MVMLLAAAVPDVVSLLQHISPASGTWYAATARASAFSSIPVNKDHQKQLAFSWQGQQYTFPVLPQEDGNCPVLYHNLAHGYLDYLSLTEDSVLVHYIGDAGCT